MTSARDFAQEFHSGTKVILCPILEIVPARGEPSPAGMRSIVFSSQHAVRQYVGPNDLPAFVIGSRTAMAAEAAGFSVAQVYETANDLVKGLPVDIPTPLLHVRGKHIAQPVAEMLGARGLSCLEWVVYDQVARPLSEEALQALRGERAVVLPLFSPRSAKLVSQAIQMRKTSAPLIAVAMSDAVANAFNADGVVATHVAAHPTGNAMKTAVREALAQGRLLEGGPALP